MANHAQVISNFFATDRNERFFTRSANVYFHGDTLFSYGAHFPMAQFVTNDTGQRAIFITSQTYSVTTARHLSLVRKAASETNLPVFFVDSLNAFETFAQVVKNAIAMHDANAQEAVEKLGRARSEWRKEDYRKQITFANRQADGLTRFEAGEPIVFNPVYPYQLRREVA